MRSSTSSSKPGGDADSPPRGQRSTTASADRAPARRWGRVWLMFAVMMVGSLAVTEALLRSAGYRPTVVDDEALWAMTRARASSDSPTTVVLLGSSRIRLGFDTARFRLRFADHQTVQLAVDGQSPLATLEDLADDERFRGVAIVSLTAERLASADIDSQAPWVEAYRAGVSTKAAIARRVDTLLQDRLAVFNPEPGLRHIIRYAISTRSLPRPLHVRTYPDRSGHADYTITDIDHHRTRHIARMNEKFAALSIEPADWAAAVDRFRIATEKISARGGRVVLLRMPTTGARWELEERRFPRARYWDVLAHGVGAPAIHFADHPTLRRFECPDTSHLDVRDAGAFTDALCDLLTERHVLGDAATPAVAAQ